MQEENLEKSLMLASSIQKNFEKSKEKTACKTAKVCSSISNIYVTY